MRGYGFRLRPPPAFSLRSPLQSLVRLQSLQYSAIIFTMKKNERDMTAGPVWEHIVFFALPLLLGNVFQQLYNTVDNVVVGNFIGKSALAAVGSSAPIVFALIGFFMGLSAGAGVVISQYYGAKQFEKVSQTVHTTMTMTFILCVILTVVGVILAPEMLKWMNTPDDVLAEGSAYLRIFFAGATGMLVYNMGAGILRAVGDSKRPLYFLIFTTLLNTGLDLLFVCVFNWGISGAAYATIFSQGLSALMILFVLTRSKEAYKIEWRKLSINRPILRQIISVGLPSAFQQLVTAVSNVFVQAYINAFGSAVMAGWSAYRSLDMFMLMPMMSVSLAATTFTGQNIGAGKADRVKAGVRTSFLLSEGITLVLILLLCSFSPQLVRIFNKESDVIESGVLFIRLLSPLYVCCVVNQIFAGVLRGAGDAKAPMLIMLSAFVLFRQIYLFIASRLSDSLSVVAFGYPMGWILCSILMYAYYRTGKWKKYAMVG